MVLEHLNKHTDKKEPPPLPHTKPKKTFWTTTGMFPQEFIICFHKHVRIERLVIQSYFVRTLRIEKSTSKEPVDFEPWIERDLVHTEGQLQNEEIMTRDGHATYLRFIIISAFDHFASVHSVSAEGLAVSNLS
uniref:Intraflagellar transport protein 25 homolog n=1 Tax=Ursus americanus TaxID=9643 RepID=A0A452RQI9_URSAM